MHPGAQVGLNLARLRREKGLTQEQLEELSDVSQQYLSGLESGVRNPTILILTRIAKALGVSLFTLLAGLDDQTLPVATKTSARQHKAGS